MSDLITTQELGLADYYLNLGYNSEMAANALFVNCSVRPAERTPLIVSMAIARREAVKTVAVAAFEPGTVVAPVTPVWETPTHQETDLATADPDVLGIDQFGSDADAQLYDAITAAKAALKTYQDFILSIFKPTDTVCLMFMHHGGKPIHDFLLVEDAIKPEYFAKLKKLNEHYSIYVGMNSYKRELIGRNDGRTKENVAAVRTLYADADEDGVNRLETIRGSNTVPPSIILESSQNKFQFIWPVEGIEKAEAELLLRAIAQTFKTDPAVAEIARVLRVPGFVNRKYLGTPQIVKLVQSSQTVSTRSDFKLDLEEIQVKVRTHEAISAESAKYKALGEAVGWSPLVRRMNTLTDSRSHATDLKPGEVVSCPFHEHRDYSNNFGVMASNPALVHCLGRCKESEKSTWDVVAAVQQFDKLLGPLDAARLICQEEGLKLEDYFPSGVVIAEKLSPTSVPSSTSFASATRLLTQRADKCLPKMVRWLWEDRVPLGKLTIFGGNPDQGKSLVSLYMAAKVTKGEPLYGSAKAIPASDVLILAAEDDPEDTIVPRLLAAQANLTRVYFVKSILVEQRDKTPEEREAQLDTDVQEVEKLLRANPEIRLIIIDPISSYLGSANMNREQEVRQVLTPLKKLADKTGVTILMIMHFNKNSEASAIHRIGGAVAFTGVSRASWVFVPEEGNPDNHLMLRLKNNLAHQKGGLVYRIDTRTIEVGDGVTSQPYVEFTGQNNTVAQDVLTGGKGEPARSPEDGRPAEKRESAEDWLRDFLSGGGEYQDDVKSFSKKAGHKWRTIERAKEQLGVASTRTYDRELNRAMYLWTLPEGMSNSVTLDQSPGVTPNVSSEELATIQA
jgi:archaellum biogenesis ATPase FlaH